MARIKAVEGQTIYLGLSGENEATEIVFDISDLLKEYPQGHCELIVRKPYVSQALPVPVVQTENEAVWTVTDSDLVTDGNGEAQLLFYCGNVCKRRNIYKTCIARSLGNMSGDVSKPDGWINGVVKVGADARQSADEAEASAVRAESYVHGGTNTRPSEDTDNAKHYYEETKKFADSILSDGTTDYTKLSKKPQINGNELVGNKTAKELGLVTKEDIPIVPTRKNWTSKMCPNIYPDSDGADMGNGKLSNYLDALNIMKKIGAEKVSLVVSFSDYKDGKFITNPNVNYNLVVQNIHKLGVRVQSVRFINNLYGKENMCNSERIRAIATTIIELVKEYGIKEELEFVGILNETSVVYFDTTYVNDVVWCIQKLQTAGLKVAITDNSHYIIQIPDSILEKLDYVGFNDYPKLSFYDSSVNGVFDAFKSYQTDFFADLLTQKGIKVFISEIGCTNKKHTLEEPLSSDFKEYAGMKDIALLFTAFKEYYNDKLKHNIESFNPWFTNLWEDDQAFFDVFKEG